MNEYLELNSSNCKHCYKCIRNCPVKAINFSSEKANIIADECVLCGRCYVKCPQNAKTIRKDIDKVKAMMRKDAPVYASIAPSFLANYPGVSFETLRKALRTLGFEDAGETAEGATMVKNRYDEMVNNEEKSVIISSCCSSVNMLIQKYFPDALPYLAKVASPMQAHCRDIKTQHPEAETVFIGPCISKKSEADNYPEYVDAALTFQELEDWMESAGVSLWTDENPDKGGKARLFPTSGGVLKTMEKSNPNYSYLVIDGMENCVAALDDIVSGRLKNCFIEMSACAGSCVAGPAMNHSSGLLSDTVEVMKRSSNNDFEINQPSGEELEKKISFIPLKKKRASTAAIEAVLRQIGKTKPEDELNCGSCGYDTCRDKAAAVLEGKAEITMCLPYLSERAQSFSDTIITNTPNGILVLDDDYKVQQINDAALEMFGLNDEKQLIGENVVKILDPYPFVEAVESGVNLYEEQVHLEKYGKYVMETIIYDADYHVVICILRDVTEEVRNEAIKEELNSKAVEITDKVIAKQMRAVQEIASLLGETTAETKVALTKLKETLADD